MAGVFVREKQLIAEEISFNSVLVVGLMEENLSQAQITALENILFPAVSDDQKLSGLWDTYRQAQRAGYANDHSMMLAIMAEIEALTP